MFSFLNKYDFLSEMLFSKLSKTAIKNIYCISIFNVERKRVENKNLILTHLKSNLFKAHALKIRACV